MFFSKIDFSITFLVTVLLAIGLTAVYSATGFSGGEALFFKRQVLFAISGFILMIGVAFIPFRFIQRVAFPFYAISIILLILVYFVGTKGFGAERWLSIGFLRIQPSEIAKISTILAVAKYLYNRDATINKWQHFIAVALLIIVPFALVFKQPDLGTSLVFASMLIPVFYWAGLKWFPLFLIISPIVTVLTSFSIIALAIWLFLLIVFLYLSKQKAILFLTILLVHIGLGITTPLLWEQLKPYQKNRIISFLNPEQDPMGAGYQVIQSQVAVGSGGVWGKGFMNGTQTHLKFLPAQHTDFIFSVIAEERGFVGVSIVLLAFLLLLIYLINLAAAVRSTFSSITVLGITCVLFFHIFVNIGMTMGVAPVTGLPLPFISYGGSFMLTVMLMIGIAQNISGNKYLV